MPTRRGSAPPSRRRSAPNGPSWSWSATNTTASTGNGRARQMMRIAEALEAFRPYRENAIVVPGRGGRYWTQQTDNEKIDATLGDPAMGGHAGFALGLALARPERKLVLFDSEGDILMILGMLATIAEQAPANFYHFLLDNEVYATTGGQPVPNAKNIAYDKLALAAGYPRAHAFDDVADLTREMPAILGRPGPVFVALKVYPEIENDPIGRRRRWQTRSRDQVIADLRTGLEIAP